MKLETILTGNYWYNKNKELLVRWTDAKRDHRINVKFGSNFLFIHASLVELALLLFLFVKPKGNQQEWKNLKIEDFVSVTPPPIFVIYFVKSKIKTDVIVKNLQICSRENDAENDET